MENNIKTIVGGAITKIKFKTQEDLDNFEIIAGFNKGKCKILVVDETIEVSDEKPFKVIFDNEE